PRCSFSLTGGDPQHHRARQGISQGRSSATCRQRGRTSQSHFILAHTIRISIADARTSRDPCRHWAGWLNDEHSVSATAAARVWPFACRGAFRAFHRSPFGSSRRVAVGRSEDSSQLRRTKRERRDGLFLPARKV